MNSAEYIIGEGMTKEDELFFKTQTTLAGFLVGQIRSAKAVRLIQINSHLVNLIMTKQEILDRVKTWSEYAQLRFAWLLVQALDDFSTWGPGEYEDVGFWEYGTFTIKDVIFASDEVYQKAYDAALKRNELP